MGKRGQVHRETGEASCCVAFNPFFVDELKNEFNAGQPTDDVADYLAPWSQLLESRGYAPDEARETVLTVLPDLLHYDRDRPAHYPMAALSPMTSTTCAWPS